MQNKKLYLIQSLVLLGGVAFAWVTITLDFINFYKIEGTIFRVHDCFVPNPVTTACFYGGVAFLIVFFWAIKIKKLNSEQQAKHQKGLFWLLVASTIFAWSNFALTLVRFLESHGEGVSCSGRIFSSPFTTPCFYGSVIFLAALIIAWVIRRKSEGPAVG